ncbi:MAG: UDP-N-acetylmuramate--L-alanine ligase [Magnetococcales bacterium]|nr:UDP-N-acetylmuramate--L-alanine ligase [Magnetococcales bacterium]
MYEKIRKLHFVGIGGIGMSGIAEVLLNLGYQVSGSDPVDNASVKRLKALGATIFAGHSEENITGVDVVIRSSAVGADNPEIVAAKQQRIPVARRAEMLAELMRIKYGIAIAGTHGKTSTTSLVASILGESGMDPTVVNGGVVKAFDSNARLGQGDFLITEADESDGSFLKLFPTIAVVTNMDPEHMEHYGSFDAVKLAFKNFVEKIPFYGLAILCKDHPEVGNLISQLPDKRITSYGLNSDADLQATNIRREEGMTVFQVEQRTTPGNDNLILGEIKISSPGRHNVANTMAAIAVGLELEIDWSVIVSALEKHRGVRRRFDILQDNDDRTIIDDYAHHPTEIKATLDAARDSFGHNRRIVAVFQPHRYSRVQALYNDFIACFSQADQVLVDHVHAAGERPPADFFPDGIEKNLIEGIERESKTQARPMPGGENWREALETLLQNGDVILFMGAGSITHRARDFANSTISEGVN